MSRCYAYFLQSKPLKGMLSAITISMPPFLTSRHIRIHFMTLKDVLNFFNYTDFMAALTGVETFIPDSDNAYISTEVSGNTHAMQTFFRFFLEEIDAFGICESPGGCYEPHINMWPVVYNQEIATDIYIQHFFVSTEDFHAWESKLM